MNLYTTSIMMAALLITNIANGFQLHPIEPKELESKSEVILAARVISIEKDLLFAEALSTEYSIITLDVAFTLKGNISTNPIQMRVATGGMRASAPPLNINDYAVLFLNLGPDKLYYLSYPLGIARFEKEHFIRKGD